MRKTALLTGVAGLFLMAAPAFAQDAPASQTPAPANQQAAEAAAPQSLTLMPGSDVKSADGIVIGQLEGARSTDAGQELTVRGSDGSLRGVPVSGGVRQDGAAIAVGWTSAQFQAAPAIADESATDTSATAAPADGDATAPADQNDVTPAPAAEATVAPEATPAPEASAPDAATEAKPEADPATAVEDTPPVQGEPSETPAPKPQA